MTDHPPTDKPPQTPTDEGLRCPECEYNLTGLVGEVCPECGERFDRSLLLEELAGAVAPIPVWRQRDADGVIRSFVLTILEIWVHPFRFGKQFPKNPELTGPRLFARICVGVAVGLVVLAFTPLLPSKPWGVIAILSVMVGVFLGVLLCEFLVAVIVFLPFRRDDPRPDGPALQSCLALVKMTRAFAVLSAVPASIGIACDSYLGPSWYDEETALHTTMVVAVYWWLCMIVIAWARTRRFWGLITALLVIPILTAFSVFVSVVIIVTLFEYIGRFMK